MIKSSSAKEYSVIKVRDYRVWIDGDAFTHDNVNIVDRSNVQILDIHLIRSINNWSPQKKNTLEKIAKLAVNSEMCLGGIIPKEYIPKPKNLDHLDVRFLTRALSNHDNMLLGIEIDKLTIQRDFVGMPKFTSVKRIDFTYHPRFGKDFLSEFQLKSLLMTSGLEKFKRNNWNGSELSEYVRIAPAVELDWFDAKLRRIKMKNNVLEIFIEDIENQPPVSHFDNIQPAALVLRANNADGVLNVDFWWDIIRKVNPTQLLISNMKTLGGSFKEAAKIQRLRDGMDIYVKNDPLGPDEVVDPSNFAQYWTLQN